MLIEPPRLACQAGGSAISAYPVSPPLRSPISST
jgi:hypothetical protein